MYCIGSGRYGFSVYPWLTLMGFSLPSWYDGQYLTMALSSTITILVANSLQTCPLRTQLKHLPFLSCGVICHNVSLAAGPGCGPAWYCSLVSILSDRPPCFVPGVLYAGLFTLEGQWLGSLYLLRLARRGEALGRSACVPRRAQVVRGLRARSPER